MTISYKPTSRSHHYITTSRHNRSFIPCDAYPVVTTKQIRLHPHGRLKQQQPRNLRRQVNCRRLARQNNSPCHVINFHLPHQHHLRPALPQQCHAIPVFPFLRLVSPTLPLQRHIIPVLPLHHHAILALPL